jgi:hypothetical protein
MAAGDLEAILDQLKAQLDELVREERDHLAKARLVSNKRDLVEKAITALTAVVNSARGSGPTMGPLAAREAQLRLEQVESATNKRGGVTDAIVDYVRLEPGTPRAELLDRLARLDTVGFANPRKVYSTRIGQLIQDRRLVDRDGRIFLRQNDSARVREVRDAG